VAVPYQYKEQQQQQQQQPVKVRPCQILHVANG
jgi:hypothetical protein